MEGEILKKFKETGKSVSKIRSRMKSGDRNCGAEEENNNSFGLKSNTFILGAFFFCAG
jgi:hypothetical protein